MSDAPPLDGQVDESVPTQPTVDELVQDITPVLENPLLQEEFEREFYINSPETEAKYVHLRGWADHYKHKGYWSVFLMVVMLGLVGFQSYLIYQVGIGKWDFSKYQWLLPLLLVQNFAQVVGLVMFVVQSLFKPLDPVK